MNLLLTERWKVGYEPVRLDLSPQLDTLSPKVKLKPDIYKP